MRIYLSYPRLIRLWNRCGEGCSSGSSLPENCDPCYVPGVCGPREAIPSGHGNVSGGTEPQVQYSVGEGAKISFAAPLATSTAQPSIGSPLDNVTGGALIQRGGSLPNPVSSVSSSSQSGAGGRASSLSSSQASRSPVAPVPHTTTPSAFSALIWKMNERDPRGMHTPAALASLAELLANPAGIHEEKPSNLSPPLSMIRSPGHISKTTCNPNDLKDANDTKHPESDMPQNAKVHKQLN